MSFSRLNFGVNRRTDINNTCVSECIVPGIQQLLTILSSIVNKLGFIFLERGGGEKTKVTILMSLLHFEKKKRN